MFFVIFGLRARNKDRGPALRWVCSKCQNDVDLHFVTRRAWGTFFFVPVLPLTGEHYLVCPTCSNWFEMTPEQVEMARAVIKRARSSVGGRKGESPDEAIQRAAAGHL